MNIQFFRTRSEEHVLACHWLNAAGYICPRNYSAVSWEDVMQCWQEG